MNQFLLRHILESTMICLLVSMVASRIQAAARTRHTIFLIAILKFAVPSAVLSAAGAQIASMIGDSAWFPLAETRISTLLITIWGVIPFRIGHNDLSIASDLILGFWVIGIVVRLNAWRLRVSEANGVMQLATPSMIRAFGRARELLGIERSVDLCICQTAEPPALAGIWRPRVLFPAHLCGKLSQPELEAVFLHELAHAKRMDNLAAAVSHLIACLFWFHPLVWWVEQRLNCERERACDELAIACGAAPQTYAGTI
ncbi:MAG: M56 family metallopeptidase, partial [Acidobacteriaceae bacterium]|nr:M56 family metallopeptidase [Acidobacteriaceae bacterium]